MRDQEPIVSQSFRSNSRDRIDSLLSVKDRLSRSDRYFTPDSLFASVPRSAAVDFPLTFVFAGFSAIYQRRWKISESKLNDPSIFLALTFAGIVVDFDSFIDYN